MRVINKQGEQLKSIENKKKKQIERNEKEEKSGEIVLLRNNLNGILMTFDMHFNND